MMTNPAIQFENVSKKYKLFHGGRTLRKDLDLLLKKIATLGRYQNVDKHEFWALKNLSFRIMPGEVLGIIGANGAGKSTLLKLISRVTYPTQGCIQTNGRISSLIEVGAGFHDELSGRENIYVNGSIIGMKRNEINKNVENIIDFAEIREFIDTPIKRYSSGMRARLGFSIAVHVSPDILLVDEVLSVGDENFRRKSLHKMHEMVNSGRTVIFISHNLEQIEDLCKRVLWLDKGTLRAEGKTQDVIGLYHQEMEKRYSE